MKYIRTKDGKIYDTLDERGMAISQIRKQCDFVDFVTFQNRLGDFAIPKTEIVKQADTIEELCDYAVYRDCYKDLVFRKLPLSTSFESLFRNMQHNMVSDVKVAILTDKGLIYVAKMNGDGVLELI